MVDKNGIAISWLDILRDDLMGEFIVLYHDPYFPDRYPEWFLMARRGSVITLGNRLPIRFASKMTRTGEQFNPENLNMATVTRPPTEEVAAAIRKDS